MKKNKIEPKQDFTAQNKSDFVKANDPDEDIKLSSIHFIADAFIDFVLVSKFEGNIILEDNYVVFEKKGVKYLVPLSNIKSAIINE